MFNRTSSHMRGRWYLPVFLFRDGLFTFIHIASLIDLLRFWSSLPTILKSSMVVLWNKITYLWSSNNWLLIHLLNLLLFQLLNYKIQTTENQFIIMIIIIIIILIIIMNKFAIALWGTILESIVFSCAVQ